MMGRAPQSPTADDPEPDAPEDETPDPTQFVRLPPPEPSEPPPAPRPASPISPRSRLGPGLVVGLLGASFVVAAGLVLLFGPWFDHPAADYAEAPGTEAASEELSPSEHEPGSGAQAPGAQSAIDDEPGLASPRSPTEAPDPSMSGIEPGSSGPASEQRSATEHPLAHAEHATTTSPPTQRTSNAAPPEPASVEVTGEATSVVFADGDERFEAGEIPPGKYVILATFPGAEAPQEAGVLTIQAGQELRVRCTSGFDRCIAEVKPPG